MRTIRTTWGQALILAVRDVHGGLNAVVTAIHGELGPFIGSRNTFAKLYGVKSPVELAGADLLRAWLVLVAIGEDPADWGIEEAAAVPASIDASRLKEALPAQVTHEKVAVRRVGNVLYPVFGRRPVVELEQLAPVIDLADRRSLVRAA